VIVRNHVLKGAEGIIVVASPVQHSGQQNVVSGMNWAISKLGPISYRSMSRHAVFRPLWREA